MPIEELQDRDEIKAFLTRDRIGNAYLLGDLDPLYLPYCTWYGNRVDGALEAVFLLYSGLRLPVLMIASSSSQQATRPQEHKERSASHLMHLFEQMQATLPSPLWVHAWENHGLVLDRFLVTSALKRMQRMGLERSSYIRPDIPEGVRVRRLDHTDTAAIMELYHHFPDNFFEPYLLETGLYFGIDAEDGLAAIAGIHVHSETYDIAAIGNLLVHPDHRRRGYATAVTSRLLDELFETVSLVTLNVRDGNVAAIGTYKKFGFVRHRVYFEGRVEGR
ncbi:MAG: GNAT family N-acetyltransferase [Myxococcota bacterium]